MEEAEAATAAKESAEAEAAVRWPATTGVGARGRAYVAFYIDAGRHVVPKM